MSDRHDAATASANDYAEHNRTYDIFITLVKWGIGGTVAVLILMAIFLL